MRILEEPERVMRHRMIKYVRVLWSQQTEHEATWELEPRMREKYPELFPVDLWCMFTIYIFSVSVASSKARKNSGSNSV